MAWIESHQTLKEHPKIYDVMDSLGISKAQAIGHLHLLWWWCVDYAPEGIISVNESKIARAAEWEGDPVKFTEALISARFLDLSDGALHVHDWLTFCGALMQRRLERREKTAANVRHMRTNGRESRPTNPTQPTVPNQTEPTAPTNHTRAVAAVEGEDLQKIIYDRIGYHRHISRLEWDNLVALKKKHGDRFFSAADTLNDSVKSPSRWIEAIIEGKKPQQPSDADMARIKKLEREVNAK